MFALKGVAVYWTVNAPVCAWNCVFVHAAALVRQLELQAWQHTWPEQVESYWDWGPDAHELQHW
jgi:hypothetical protein